VPQNSDFFNFFGFGTFLFEVGGIYPIDNTICKKITGIAIAIETRNELCCQNSIGKEVDSFVFENFSK
jgi:hypothetical protein